MNLQKHAKESCSNIGGRSADHTSYDTNQHQADNMQPSIVRFAGGPCHKERYQEGSNPDGRGDKEGLDSPITQSLDNSREEVLEVLGEERCMLDQDE